MNEKEKTINPKIIREKILTELNKINIKRIKLENEEYSDLNNYGYLNLKKLTPKMLELSKQIKNYYTSSSSSTKINNTNYKLLIESFKNKQSSIKAFENNKIPNYSYEPTRISTLIAGNSIKKKSRKKSNRKLRRLRKKTSKKSRRKTRRKKYIGGTTRPYLPITQPTTQLYLPTTPTTRPYSPTTPTTRPYSPTTPSQIQPPLPQIQPPIPPLPQIQLPIPPLPPLPQIQPPLPQIQPPIPPLPLPPIPPLPLPQIQNQTTTLIIFLITDRITPLTYMFETTQLINMIKYKKMIVPPTYTPMRDIFDAFQMRNDIQIKYNYNINNYDDVTDNTNYNNENIIDMVFDQEITPNVINYYYLYEDDTLDTRYVKESDITITADDITSMKCYTSSWDNVLNPYLYDNSNYWTATGNGPIIISNSNPLTNSREPTLNLPQNCRTAIDSTTNLPKIPVDRVVLEEEIKNKINKYYELFFNKGRLTENNEVLYDSTRTKTVYRGMTRPMINLVKGQLLLLQAYTSTTLNYFKAHDFAIDQGRIYEDPYIYEITFDSGIPYISYDSTPYISVYPREEEILFPINCYINIIDDPIERPLLTDPSKTFKFQKLHISWDLDLPLLEDHNTKVIESKIEIKFLGTQEDQALEKLIELFPQINSQ